MGKLSNYFGADSSDCSRRAEAAARARILHVLPGRVRLHLPGWSACDREGLETRLAKLAGVRRVQANARTGNVLVHFDPKATNATSLLVAAGRLPAPRSLPLHRLVPRDMAAKAAAGGAAAAQKGSRRLGVRAAVPLWLDLSKALLQVGGILTGVLARDRLHLVLGGAETLLRLGSLLARLPA
jgi:hypothetical protein